MSRCSLCRSMPFCHTGSSVSSAINSVSMGDDYKGFGNSYRQVDSGKTGCRVIPILLQPVVLGPKAQQQIDNQSIPTKRGVVISLDLSDAYFHIPIIHRSRKYLRLFLNKQTYPFTVFTFGLATALLEFTKLVKEVKLMTQSRGLRIHQYLDSWLLKAPCQETWRQHTQTLWALCHDLGWVVNMISQQELNFVYYRLILLTSRVLSTRERWSALQQKLQFIKGRETCTVRQFMSLTDLLTATEKQLWSGRH